MDTGATAPPDRGSLGRQATGALGWSMLSVAAGRLGTMGIGIVLARFLGPHEFGTYAVAYVALVAVLSFSELGVSLAIVRWPTDPKEIAPTVSTISLVASLGIAAVGVLIAPIFTAAMGNTEATAVVRLLALNVVISGIVQTPAALMQRAFMQRTRMIIDQVNVWVGALISISMAVMGAGAMSLAVGRLSGAAVSAVLFLRYSPLPYRLGYDRLRARALLVFGLPLAGASILVFLVGYSDQVVVGHVLGTTALGFYVLAFNLSGWPVSLFSLPMRSVAPAAFARLQHDPPAMRSALTMAVALLSSLAIPVCVCLAAAAVPLIELVYGPAWVPAADVLRWLSIVAAVRIFHELAYDYLVVLGRSHAVMWVQGLWLVTVVPLMVVGSHLWGLAGVAAAQLVVSVAVVIPAYLLQLRRQGVLGRPLLRSVVPALLVGLGVAAAVAETVRVVPPAWASLVLTAAVGTLAIGLLLYPRRSMLGQIRRREPAAGSVVADARRGA